MAFIKREWKSTIRYS